MRRVYVLALLILQTILHLCGAYDAHHGRRNLLFKRRVKIGNEGPHEHPAFEDCTDAQRDTISTAVDGAREMLEKARSRLYDLNASLEVGQKWQKPGFHPTQGDWPLDRAATYQLFRIMIYYRFDLKRDPKNHKRLASIDGEAHTARILLDRLIQRAENIALNINRNTERSNGSVQIVCGTEWLSNMKRDPTLQKHYRYTGFDNRPNREVVDGLPETRHLVELDAGPFMRSQAQIADRPDSVPRIQPDAYLFSGMAGPWTSVIALNPLSFDKWNTSGLRWPMQYPTKYAGSSSGPVYSLPELSNHNLPSRLVEMFARLPDITEEPPLDQAKGQAKGQRLVNHSWLTAIDVAQTDPEVACNSPANFMFLITGLFLGVMPWNPNDPNRPQVDPILLNDNLVAPEKSNAEAINEQSIPPTSTAPKSNDLKRKRPASSIDGAEEGPEKRPKLNQVPEQAPVKYKNAQQAYDAMFPNGIQLIDTDGSDLLCGLRAAIASMNAMYPSLPQPTVDELLAILHSPEYQEQQSAFQLDNENDFHIDQVGALLQTWGRRHNDIPLQVGAIFDGQMFLVPYDGRKNPFIVWVHNAPVGGGIRGVEAPRHFSGVKPADLSEPAPSGVNQAPWHLPQANLESNVGHLATIASSTAQREPSPTITNNAWREQANIGRRRASAPQSSLASELSMESQSESQTGTQPRRSERLAGIPPDTNWGPP